MKPFSAGWFQTPYVCKRKTTTREEFMAVVWWIVVGLIAGWATGKIMRGAGYGAVIDIVIGIIGAVIGGWIMRSLGFAGQGGMIYTILVAIGGAIVLTLLFRLIFGSRSGGTGSGGLRRAA
jgi:uncharacterized membrane protein YeaQ/YmgE (transglycosylase-associated protein family)